ncbi:hypothetical protein EBU91_01325 [bacterium]|nr:hypothetical protein [bacterium]
MFETTLGNMELVVEQDLSQIEWKIKFSELGTNRKRKFRCVAVKNEQQTQYSEYLISYFIDGAWEMIKSDTEEFTPAVLEAYLKHYKDLNCSPPEATVKRMVPKILGSMVVILRELLKVWKFDVVIFYAHHRKNTKKSSRIKLYRAVLKKYEEEIKSCGYKVYETEKNSTSDEPETGIIFSIVKREIQFLNKENM